MVLGYANRVALVDLSAGSVSYTRPDEQLLGAVLGGRGLGAAMLYRHARKTDPLAEKSMLFAGVGPLTGSGFPLANRLTFVFRSPQTGTIAWANTGGYAGAELKTAGFDAIVVTGRSEMPVYLFVQNSQVSINDATRLRGRGAVEIVAGLRDHHGNARVLAIGPAGENLVSFANVVNDTGRTSGVRHGVGSVMGSKMLKAIVIKGDFTRRLEVADHPAHIESVRRMIAKVRDSVLLNHETGLLAVHGTPIAAEFLGKNEALPVRNYQTSVLRDYSTVGGHSMTDTVLTSRLTCADCPVGCRRETAAVWPHSFQVEGPDFAQISSLGTNCFVLSLKAIGYMNRLCYEYGIDPIEMGNELAMLAEHTQGGDAKDGLGWGDQERMIELIHQTAFREGMGDLLSQGPERLASGLGSPRLSMSVKGITIQNTDPRVEPAWGLLNATENFGGAAHIWVYADLVTSLREAGVPTLVRPESAPEEVASAVKYRQDLVAALDSLQVCAFSSYSFSPDDYASEMNNLTGSRMTADDLLKTGERIVSIEHQFNIENGFGPAADTLPERFLSEPLTEGMHRGKVCELEPMLSEYRRIRGRTSSSLNDLPSLF